MTGFFTAGFFAAGFLAGAAFFAATGLLAAGFLAAAAFTVAGFFAAAGLALAAGVFAAGFLPQLSWQWSSCPDPDSVRADYTKGSPHRIGTDAGIVPEISNFAIK
ncbi:hypothetical protein [Henriciella pelagia]|uniref:hypothetical protein n=1 Tax=Henriciella pelagia TaxID=1977912 RepID=UPI001301C631|nr:hypothetical protein [Henriciella pelagia]